MELWVLDAVIVDVGCCDVGSLQSIDYCLKIG